jgi:hypothetical protein
MGCEEKAGSRKREGERRVLHVVQSGKEQARSGRGKVRLKTKD